MCHQIMPRNIINTITGLHGDTNRRPFDGMWKGKK